MGTRRRFRARRSAMAFREGVEVRRVLRTMRVREFVVRRTRTWARVERRCGATMAVRNCAC
jgi:hypothetical protein